MAVWAAQAGARKVYAGKFCFVVIIVEHHIYICKCIYISTLPFLPLPVYRYTSYDYIFCILYIFETVEYTDMAKHARSVMEANGVSDIVTVIQGAVEDIELPYDIDSLEPEDGNNNNDDGEKDNRVVDIIISEWMGYFLLRESMLDSLIRARDKFLKPKQGLMLPSHCTMYIAPVTDEEERRLCQREYSSAMGDWTEFVETTRSTYGVNMGVLGPEFEREQKEYYLLSSRWTELHPESVLGEPQILKEVDMHTCTLSEARGITAAGGIGGDDGLFDFDVSPESTADTLAHPKGGSPTDYPPVSGFAGWFTADFKSRTDPVGATHAPKLRNPAFLSTGPEAGYTHWGQQTFHLPTSIPLLRGEVTRLKGSLEMTRSRENARLYNCRIRYNTSRRKAGEGRDGATLMKGEDVENVYQIP